MMDEMERLRKEAERRDAYLEQRRQRRNQRQRYVRRVRFFMIIGAAVAGVSVFLLVSVLVLKKNPDMPAQQQGASAVGTEAEEKEPSKENTKIPDNTLINVGDAVFLTGYHAQETADTLTLPDESENMVSEYAILINENTNEIVAYKNAMERINPASMTKVMTILVAAEHVSEEDMETKEKITRDVTDYVYVNECSIVGYELGEKATVRDLFYGTILPSGGDAAVTLAKHVAGTHEAFVEMMNDKLAELGLSETAHFTNCVGLYDENHYCTVYDMAMILKAALQNDFCREVLSKHIFTTTATKKHPDGITVSNWFLRRIEDRDTGGVVVGAKTGYVEKAGNCAASYMISNSGIPYICVTAKSKGSWQCIFDHVYIYKNYAQ